MHPPRSFDVVVVGAGVFGAWIAHTLQRSGQRVALIDAYGPGNSRASSGGESRIIRMGYGGDEVYTRWSVRSLALWNQFARDAHEPLFHKTGVLWLARDQDTRVSSTLTTLQALAVKHRRLSCRELGMAYPQMAFDGIGWGVLEPDSGVLMARRAVRAIVREAIRLGTVYCQDRVPPPAEIRAMERLTTMGGSRFEAETFVFACGPWLPSLFPDVVGARIRPTRQEVFFFGPSAGDARFAPPQMPAWIDFEGGVYGVPDLEHRGFKIAFDRHGPAFDPEREDRVTSEESLRAIRAALAHRFPPLAAAPLLEARVCQYENTSSGDFLIDRHPDVANVWLVGGGSGHGFKHGPALAEYVAGQLRGSAPAEPRFSLATKETVKNRAVY